MESNYYLSICIPAYNRHHELARLLKSIDTKYADEIEIVVAEDMSSERKLIKSVVDRYKSLSPYTINYYENEVNYGYDKNIRQTAKKAKGRWVMYMGNDDMYVKGSLDRYIEWLKEHDHLGYILRRYLAIRPDKTIEQYRYAKGDVFFEPGEAAIIELYRRSIFISGFTFRKDLFNDYDCPDFDGMLMFQLYILATICNENKSAYCDIPLAKWMVGGIPDFGMCEAEKKLYKSGSNSIQNSLNYLSQIRRLTEGVDCKLGTNIVDRIMKSYSKYSYGYLYEHRDDGIKEYRRYAKEIKKMGLGDSVYYSVYYYALLFLGTKNCQRIIKKLKIIVGHTPRL